MTADKFLKDKGWYAGSLMLSKNKGQGLVSITEAMEEYHQAKLKLLGIADVVGRSEQLCDHPRSERSYIGQNMLRCKKCGKEFS